MPLENRTLRAGYYILGRPVQLRSTMRDFQSLFGLPPTVIADAPGRVNLIGEHTDYNGGFVLPTAIPQRTQVELCPRSDRQVCAWTTASAETPIESYELGSEKPGRGWLDYLQGVTLLLANAGMSFSGFDVRLESHVPLGSGLSSSAALTVAITRTLRQAFDLPLDDVQIARLGQRVENEFVGARVGIMDPMAASLADEGTALFLDCHTLAYQRVPLPADAELIVLHSGVTHSHAAGDYNTRRGECERACELLGVGQLRDLTVDDLARVERLPEPLSHRACHVITENARVQQAVDAMRSGDLARLGELFYASHASMRDDYEVSVPAIDLIVRLAAAEKAVFGARLTGGGFGGSVVMFARAGEAKAAAQHIADVYAKQSRHEPRVLVPAC